jgi:hypothetical protein
VSYYKIGEDFHWFIGRVVNIKDDEYRLGRVQVRVIESQSGDNLGKPKSTGKGIPDDSLLWAWPISAIQSASLHQAKLNETEQFGSPDWIGAVGLSPTGIAKGTYVYGFYLDGVEKNIPLIFGTYHKKSILPEKDSEGGTFLQTKNTPGQKEAQWDVAPLAQGDFTDPQGTEVKGQSLPKEEYEAKLKKNKDLNEPESPYKTEYPYNLTYTSKSGHAIELDDTPNHERVHVWHQSGSYEEVANGEGFKGRRVKKTVDDDFTVIKKNENRIVGGNSTEEITGNNLTQILANDNHHVSLDQAVLVGGRQTVYVEKDQVTVVNGSQTVTIAGDNNIVVEGYVNLAATGGINLTGPVTINGHLTVTGGVTDKTAPSSACSFPSGKIAIIKNGIIKTMIG